MSCYQNRNQSGNCQQNRGCGCSSQNSCGGRPYAVNLKCIANRNKAYRTKLWSGCHLQATLLCIPPCKETEWEMSERTDQVILVEEGQAIVKIGKCKCRVDYQQCLCSGDALFIPACYWFSIANTGECPLKLVSFSAPPRHSGKSECDD